MENKEFTVFDVLEIYKKDFEKVYKEIEDNYEIDDFIYGSLTYSIYFNILGKTIRDLDDIDKYKGLINSDNIFDNLQCYLRIDCDKDPYCLEDRDLVNRKKYIKILIHSFKDLEIPYIYLDPVFYINHGVKIKNIDQLINTLDLVLSYLKEIYSYVLKHYEYHYE